MAHLPERAHQLLRAQHGVIGLDQLLEAGVPRRRVRRLVEVGELRAGLKGAYRSPSVAVDELSRCAEVCIARPAVDVAGPAAGRLWGLRHCRLDRRIGVIAPRGSNPSIAAWVIPFRTNAIDRSRDTIHRRDGIRVTTPARTALDLARYLPPARLGSVIEQVMAEHRVSEQALIDVADEWRSPGRPWIDTFLRQLGRRLPGGGADSHPEVVVGNGLRRRGVRHLVRQHPVDLPNFGPAQFDLAVPRLLWAIEVDVHPTHEETAGLGRDEDRDDAAESVGWTVSRVSARDYDRNLDRRLDELAEVYTRLQRCR